MEHYRICNSCGHGFVFTDDDFKMNTQNAGMNVLSSVGALAGALSGNWGGAIANQNNIEEIRDFSKCPHCGSHDLRIVSQAVFQQQYKKAAGGPVVAINPNASVEALIKRTKLLLEDQEWEKAAVYCEQILDTDPENGEAYLLSALAELKASSLSALVERRINLQGSKFYKNIQRFADDSLIKEIDDTDKMLKQRLIEDKQKAEEAKKLELFHEAVAKYSSDEIEIVSLAIPLFQSLSEDFKECEEYINKCESKINELTQRQKKSQKKAIIICAVSAAVILISLLIVTGVHNRNVYSQAMELWEAGNKIEAVKKLNHISSYSKAEIVLNGFKEELIGQLCRRWSTSSFTNSDNYGWKFEGIYFLVINRDGTAYLGENGKVYKWNSFERNATQSFNPSKYTLEITDEDLFLNVGGRNYTINFIGDQVSSLTTKMPVYSVQTLVFK